MKTMDSLYLPSTQTLADFDENGAVMAIGALGSQ